MTAKIKPLARTDTHTYMHALHAAWQVLKGLPPLLEPTRVGLWWTYWSTMP